MSGVFALETTSLEFALLRLATQLLATLLLVTCGGFALGGETTFLDRDQLAFVCCATLLLGGGTLALFVLVPLLVEALLEFALTLGFFLRGNTPTPIFFGLTQTLFELGLLRCFLIG